MREFLHNDCEGVDAAVFSGDVLYNEAERAALKKYVGRWMRAIDSHEGASHTQVLVVPAGDALDAITVIFRDHGDRRGEVVVTCYGQAWMAWFGSMPEETIRAFFINAPEGYMATKLAAQQFRLLKSEEKRQGEYLSRIERRVRKFLKGELG